MRPSRPVSVVLTLLLLLVAAVLTIPYPGAANDAQTLALVGGTIYPSPDSPPIRDGVVLIRGTKIVSVGPKNRVKVPAGATILDCSGMFLTAGFQNSHVHFTEPKWENAAAQPTDQLAAHVREMLIRYGFTTVVDTGSFLDNTLALRRRIESGEVLGPRILTAGTPLYPENGIPYYLKNSLPPEILSLLPTPKTPEEAAAIVKKQLDSGADIVKLFTGSWVEHGKILPMSPAVASAAAAVAHTQHSASSANGAYRRGKIALVFSHASSIAGLEVALTAHVDVLAHALDDDRGWNQTHIACMKTNRMSMVPTLKLFGGQSYTKYILQEVGDFSRAGGQILFGTDVGYMTDYDPSAEYALMSQAGLDWRRILASLTTAPAERFDEAHRRGKLAPSMDADVVALAADPASDPKAFANVRYTLRLGRVIYSQ